MSAPPPSVAWRTAARSVHAVGLGQVAPGPSPVSVTVQVVADAAPGTIKPNATNAAGKPSRRGVGTCPTSQNALPRSTGRLSREPQTAVARDHYAGSEAVVDQ